MKHSTRRAIKQLRHLRGLSHNALRRWQISQYVFCVVDELAASLPSGKGWGGAKSADDCPLRHRCGELKSKLHSSAQFRAPDSFEAFKAELRKVGAFDGKMELLLAFADALMITVRETLVDEKRTESEGEKRRRESYFAYETVAKAYDALCGDGGAVGEEDEAEQQRDRKRQCVEA